MSNLHRSEERSAQASELLENRGVQIDGASSERERCVQLPNLDGDRLGQSHVRGDGLAGFIELMRQNANDIVHGIADSLLQLRRKPARRGGFSLMKIRVIEDRERQREQLCGNLHTLLHAEVVENARQRERGRETPRGRQLRQSLFDSQEGQRNELLAEQIGRGELRAALHQLQMLANPIQIAVLEERSAGKELLNDGSGRGIGKDGEQRIQNDRLVLKRGANRDLAHAERHGSLNARHSEFAALLGAQLVLLGRVGRHLAEPIAHHLANLEQKALLLGELLALLVGVVQPVENVDFDELLHAAVLQVVRQTLQLVPSRVQQRGERLVHQQELQKERNLRGSEVIQCATGERKEICIDSLRFAVMRAEFALRFVLEEVRRELLMTGFTFFELRRIH